MLVLLTSKETGFVLPAPSESWKEGGGGVGHVFERHMRGLAVGQVLCVKGGLGIRSLIWLPCVRD